MNTSPNKSNNSPTPKSGFIRSLLTIGFIFGVGVANGVVSTVHTPSTEVCKPVIGLGQYEKIRVGVTTLTAARSILGCEGEENLRTKGEATYTWGSGKQVLKVTFKGDIDAGTALVTSKTQIGLR
ncbi:hypothetical protein WJM97_11090 [Okeanomitos corallinicola TIOX110]|uniref:Uncharacterized protein n=1 Tax=Okeanomitos corallinicola TIOX110 TaxID=3133117 RepID=A0ABZ2UNA6_9CYAN